MSTFAILFEKLMQNEPNFRYFILLVFALIAIHLFVPLFIYLFMLIYIIKYHIKLGYGIEFEYGWGRIKVKPVKEAPLPNPSLVREETK